MNFTAEYQVTFEEFKEASLVVANRLRKEISGRVSSRKRSPMGLILFISLAVVFYLLLRARSATSSGDRSIPFIDSFWPWLIILVGFCVAVVVRARKIGRRKIQMIWNGTPNLHRMRTIQIDDEGISTAHATAHSHANWQHYLRFEETTNLFLLFISNHNAEFIPKRIFSDSSDVDTFRRLLTRKIAVPTQAFPVIPMSIAEAKLAEQGEAQ